MFKKFLWVFLLIFLMPAKFVFGQNPPEEIPKSVGPKKFILLSLQGNTTLNQDLRPEFFVPIPFAFYFSQGQSWDWVLMSGGIFNLGIANYNFNRHWSVGLKAQSFFFFAGDIPFIDGDDFNSQYTFRGHRVGGDLMITRKFWIKDRFPFLARLSLGGQYRHFYSDPQTSGFEMPESFWTLEPNLFFGVELPPLSELRLYGYFPSLTLAYEKRFGSSDWGIQNEFTEDQFFKGELAFSAYHKLNDALTLVFKADAAIVTNADRLNALSRGKLNGFLAFNQMFLSQVSTERSTSNELGLRVYANSKKNLAFKASTFTAAYRELLLQGTRDQFAVGGQVSILGSLLQQRRLNYQLNYGVIHGVDETQVLHQIGYNLSYRFKP